MKRLFFTGLLLPITLFSFAQVTVPINRNEPFSKRQVGNNYNNAWEVLYGPNDSLWITENRSYRIRRINVKDDGISTFGGSTNLISLFDNPARTSLGITITQTTNSFPQGGLMGMALHPNLYSTDPAVRNAKPWVYVAFVYTKATPNATTCPNGGSGCFYTTKIVRFTYSGNTLINPETVLDNIPGSSDHNSGRLVISPEIETLPAGGLHNQYRLYYTVGDMGAGQFANTTRAQNSLVQNSFEGKVLRINTEIDGDANQNAWVPNDNPFFNAGNGISAEDYVFSLGHRNAQGLVWGKVNGVNRLYSSEQMDKTDDEINIIAKGRNYGWDRVSGYCDGNVNGYTIGRTAIGNQSHNNEQANCNSITYNTPPIYTMFTGQMSSMPSDNALWPTIACSSIDFLGKSKIAEWSNSLFVTPLKKDFVYRLKLNETGDGVQPVIYELFRGEGGRIRDIAISPNGRRFFVARDGGTNTSNGTIWAYNYTGELLALNDKPTDGILAQDNIDIFPNPATNIITVKGKKEFQKPLLAQLYDVTGSVVETKSSFQNTFTLDISKQKSGIYFLKLYNGNGQLVESTKVVKQ